MNQQPDPASPRPDSKSEDELKGELNTLYAEMWQEKRKQREIQKAIAAAELAMEPDYRPTTESIIKSIDDFLEQGWYRITDAEPPDRMSMRANLQQIERTWRDLRLLCQLEGGDHPPLCPYGIEDITTTEKQLTNAMWEARTWCQNRLKKTNTPDGKPVSRKRNRIKPKKPTARQLQCLETLTRHQKNYSTAAKELRIAPQTLREAIEAIAIKMGHKYLLAIFPDHDQKEDQVEGGGGS